MISRKIQKVLRHYLRARVGGQASAAATSNGFLTERDKPEGNEKQRRRRGDGIIAEMKEIRNLKGEVLRHSWACQSWIANKKS